MTKLNIILASLLGLLVTLSGFLAVKTLPDSNVVFGGVTPGLHPSTTTRLSYDKGLVSASGTAGILFEANNNCVTRIVSTASSSIRIGIGTSTASAVDGFLQLGSTTVAYAATDYGCNMWTVFGFPVDKTGPAAATIKIEEIR